MKTEKDTRNWEQRKFYRLWPVEFHCQWEMRTHRCTHTHRKERQKPKKSFTVTNDRHRGEKRLACCSTWSHSRLANDGTWLGWRSLACLSGVTDGGGTPDVDADRPNLQLALGSAKEKRRKYTREQEVGYSFRKLKHGGPTIPLRERHQAWLLVSLGHLPESRTEVESRRSRIKTEPIPCPGLFPLL